MHVCTKNHIESVAESVAECKEGLKSRKVTDKKNRTFGHDKPITDKFNAKEISLINTTVMSVGLYKLSTLCKK